MADCAALPALFFSSVVHPFGSGHAPVAAYLDRLLERPSIRRTLSQAQPYFEMFPYRESMPARYFEPFL